MTSEPERAGLTSRIVALSVMIYFCSVILAALFWEKLLRRLLERVEDATKGWLSPQLVLPVATLIVILLVVGIRRLRLAEVGWSGAAVLPGCAASLAAWAAMHVGLVGFAWSEGREVAWIHESPASTWLPASCAQLFGNALLEEAVFRGLLVGELSRLLKRRTGWAAVVTACGISLFLFTLSHAPRLMTEADVDRTALIFWTLRFGAVLTAAYLLTRNLFACVGAHAIWNAGPFLIAGTSLQQIEVVWSSAVIGVAVAYYCLKRRRHGTSNSTIEEPNAVTA